MKEAGLAKPQVFEGEEVRREKAQNQEAGSLEPSVWVGGVRTPSMVIPSSARGGDLLPGSRAPIQVHGSHLSNLAVDLGDNAEIET